MEDRFAGCSSSAVSAIVLAFSSWSVPVAMGLSAFSGQKAAGTPEQRSASTRTDCPFCAALTATATERPARITADIACRKSVELSPSVTKRQPPVCKSGGRRVSPGDFRVALTDAQRRCDDVIDNSARLTSTITLVCGW